MGDVQPLAEQGRRLVASDEPSVLQATWHSDAGVVVISLWRDETCIGTSRLAPDEAGRLAIFVTRGLAELATDALDKRPIGSADEVELKRFSIRQLDTGLRSRAAVMLERLARVLRR